MSAHPRTNARRDPSLRDREIHRQVKVSCRRQCQVAEQFGLSAGQVSRIVRRVQAWRGAQQPEDRGELPYAAQQRVGRWLAQERAEEMYVEARRLVEETEGAVFGVQGSAQNGEDKGQENESGALQLRRMAVRMQAIKTALKAAQEAYELSQAEPPPPPSPAEDEQQWRKRTIQELGRLREAAEEAGKVPVSLSPYELAKCLLEALVGGPQYLKPRGTHGPGSAYWQVAEALVSGSRDDATLRAKYGEASGAANTEAEASAANSTSKLGGLAPQPVEESRVPSTEYSVPHEHDAAWNTTSPGPFAGAQPRNIPRAASEVGCDVGNDFANQDANAACDEARAAIPEPASGEVALQKPRKLRASKPADDESESVGSKGPAPEVGSPEWQAARAKWLADRDRRAMLEAARKIAERYEREAELREARAAAAARRHGIRSTEPWSLTPDS